MQQSLTLRPITPTQAQIDRLKAAVAKAKRLAQREQTPRLKAVA